MQSLRLCCVSDITWQAQVFNLERPAAILFQKTPAPLPSSLTSILPLPPSPFTLTSLPYLLPSTSFLTLLHWLIDTATPSGKKITSAMPYCLPGIRCHKQYPSCRKTVRLTWLLYLRIWGQFSHNSHLVVCNRGMCEKLQLFLCIRYEKKENLRRKVFFFVLSA